jgi:hypothetical protein
LTNGVQLSVFEDNVESEIIISARTLYQLMIQIPGADFFGNNTTVNEIGQAGSVFGRGASTDDAFYCNIDFTRLTPYGIRLAANDSTDRIVMRIRDDLTGLSTFFVRLFGYKIFGES